MPAPKSTTLFHFTRSLDVLKSILKHGFIPHFSLEDISWMGAPTHNFIAFPVVCFCDIPLSRITDHIGFYGQYGIGMKQEWAIANGLNPLIYISQTSHLAVLMKKSFTTAQVAETADKDKSHMDNVRYIIGFSKPLSGTMLIGGKAVTKKFYQESEWRFLARHAEIPLYLNKGNFDDPATLDNANKAAEQFGKLALAPNDVKYLFVEQEDNIPELVKFIDTELDFYPQKDLKILMTRIVSQDTIDNDI